MKHINYTNLQLAITLVLFVFISTMAIGQGTEIASDAATTMTDVQKKVTKGTNYTSIFMIAGVVAIVGLAIYLSFSNEKEEEHIK
jgi:hypothetical protein